MRALLLIAHGSQSKKAGEEVAALAARLRAEAGFSIVEHAYLDVDRPDIPEGLARCVDAGAKEILVLPHFLNSGNHVLHDIPKIVDEEKTRYVGVRIRIAKPIGAHERLIELYVDLARGMM